MTEEHTKFDGERGAVESKDRGMFDFLGKKEEEKADQSSDEEEGEDKKKKKENKGLKEKIKEKIGGEKKEDDSHDTAVPVEKCDSETSEKGFMKKSKRYSPLRKMKRLSHHRQLAASIPAEKVAVVHHEEESKENKGFLEKIKENIPGYHSKTEDDKVKEKETIGSH